MRLIKVEMKLAFLDCYSASAENIQHLLIEAGLDGEAEVVVGPKIEVKDVPIPDFETDTPDLMDLDASTSQSVIEEWQTKARQQLEAF